MKNFVLFALFLSFSSFANTVNFALEEATVRSSTCNLDLSEFVVFADKYDVPDKIQGAVSVQMFYIDPSEKGLKIVANDQSVEVCVKKCKSQKKKVLESRVQRSFSFYDNGTLVFQTIPHIFNSNGDKLEDFLTILKNEEAYCGGSL